MRVLQQGLQGSDVRKWQLFLIGQRLDAAPADGDFGPRTHKATLQFQARHGLVADGIVGLKTLGAAMKLGFEAISLGPSRPAPQQHPNAGDPSWPPRPSFNPLFTNAERAKKWGSFRYEAAPIEGNRENIRILGSWESDNIVRVEIPQLRGIDGAPASTSVRFHRKGADQLRSLWRAWESAGLLDLVLTWDGSFTPRFVRGSTSVLSNHCLPAGEMVWTSEGAVPIEEMRDFCGLVWAFKDGQAVLRRPVAFYDNGEKSIVRVNCVGHSFRCTPDHPVLVLRKHTLPKGEWVPHRVGRGHQKASYWTEMVHAGELKPGDRVVSARRMPAHGDVEADLAWAEVVGLFIGDGCVGHRKGDPEYVSFSIPRADRIRSHAERLLERCFGARPKSHDKALIYYAPHIVARFAPYDKTARQKDIPREVWSWTPEAQRAFVRGYVYSDGTVVRSQSSSGGGHQARYQFKAASRSLIHSLKMLLTSMGLRCSRIHIEAAKSMAICGVPTRSSGCWHFSAVDVSGALDTPADPLYLERIQDASRPKQGNSPCWGYETVAPNFTHHCVQSIHSDGFERVFDITVEDAHNFITDGVVVSNCFGSAFDINAAWNALGSRPALVGQRGSVRELVQIANKNGFFWGGHFRDRADGMHFEVARDL